MEDSKINGVLDECLFCVEAAFAEGVVDYSELSQFLNKQAESDFAGLMSEYNLSLDEVCLITAKCYSHAVELILNEIKRKIKNGEIKMRTIIHRTEV